MIFKPELAEAVMAGTKTVTRRLCSDNPRSPWAHDRGPWRTGKVVTVQPGRGVTNIGHVRILSMRRERLGRLDAPEAKREGFDSVEAFEATFEGLNGGYDERAWVWRLEFEVCAGHEVVVHEGRPS
jgi:hypothetical protein